MSTEQPLDDTALERDLLDAADDVSSDVEDIAEDVVEATTDSRGVRPQILAVAALVGVGAVIAAVLAARRRT